MTNGLIIFLALYALVGQPAIIGWMLDNTQLYQLAGLNAGIFLIALIISAICKPNKSKPADNSAKLVEKSEERVSRIENDNGVSIMQVEKKTEVVVQGNDENIEENLVEPEKLEEKVEEKPEEKTEERPMKETVTIPKIVQPLTGHTPTKRRKREVKWGQRLVLLITLGLAAIMACTLREFLETRGIAIALFLGWMLYLVIGKLFDINGFYNAKKLFTNRLYIILILAGIGYGVYVMQSKDKSFLPSDFGEKVTSYVKSRFESDNDDDSETNTGDIIYVFEGTGEVITDTEDNTPILDGTGITESEIEDIKDGTEYTETNTGDTEKSEPENKVQPQIEEENQTTELSPEEIKQQVTMGEAIKSLLAGATLSTKTNTTFKYVSKSNELYPYFKTAQEKGMIGTDTDPSKIVSCETYITMKGLREGWNVGNYVKSEIKSAYWGKATELGKLNGCKKGAYVTKGNL